MAHVERTPTTTTDSHAVGEHLVVVTRSEQGDPPTVRTSGHRAGVQRGR